MSELGLTILVGSAMFVGLVGTVLPALPDIPLIWVAALGYGFLVEWVDPSTGYFIAISVLGLLGVVTEVWVSGIGARAGGASLLGVLGGFVLGTIGLLAAGPVGAVIGLLVGTFAVEYFRDRDHQRASRATLGLGLGCTVSVVVKFGLGLVMVILWVVWLVTVV
ncbi:MAG: DUF456 domain-containing protein [Anaerolineales bacterium]